jgi:hypothetical protein
MMESGYNKVAETESIQTAITIVSRYFVACCTPALAHFHLASIPLARGTRYMIHHTVELETTPHGKF